MQKLISMIIGFILTLGLTSATYDFYRILRKETLIKASKKLYQAIWLHSKNDGS